MDKDTNKCPHCGSMAKLFLYTISTLMYYTPRYDEEGNAIQADRNISHNFYKCTKCGEEFACPTI